MSALTPQSVDLMQEYEKLGLAKPVAAEEPDTNTGDDTSGPADTAANNGVGDGADDAASPKTNTIEHPELVRILEYPKRQGYGLRRIKLDSFDDHVDMNGADEEEEWSKYALLMRREVNIYGRPRKIQLEVQSARLRSIFLNEAQNFHDINIESDPIVIPAPYHVLFFLHKRFQELSQDPELDPLTREELKLLVNYSRSRECLGTVFERWDTLVPHGKVAFDILWTLFPPYKMVYFHRDRDEQCYLLEYCVPMITPEGGLQGLFNVIRGVHDSTDFGLEQLSVVIPSFRGIKNISTTDLEIIPFENLGDEQAAVKKRLLERARKYLKLQRTPYTYLQMMSGRGGGYFPYETLSEVSMRLISNKVKSIKSNSNGRLVVDQTAFEEKYPSESPEFIAKGIRDFISRKFRNSGDSRGEKSTALAWEVPDLGYPQTPNDNNQQTSSASAGAAEADVSSENDHAEAGDAHISEADMLICDSNVRGFLLDKQVWVKVSVEYLEPIDFYPNTWATLQLGTEKKDVIRAMVDGFLRESEISFVGWEQIIIKKGNGLLFLLHGGPGLGKTYTAEALSEESQRPLYRITTGELGTQVDQFERRLASVFRLGHRWGAIVLLDEADIVMAKRDKNNLDRNALVGVFLRLMEYYEGLLFLTTNRYSDLDTAFSNRIHASIEYTPHDKQARKNIWRQILHDSIRLLTPKENTAAENSDEGVRRSQQQRQPALKNNDGEGGNNPAAINISDDVCDILADLDCNGRDIRNIIRAAMSIANSEKETLRPQHVLRVIKSLSNAVNKGDVIPRFETVSAW